MSTLRTQGGEMVQGVLVLQALMGDLQDSRSKVVIGDSTWDPEWDAEE